MTQRALYVIEKTRSFVDFRNNLIQLKIRAFEPKISFELDFGNFIVKTAQTKKELQDILQLRYKVFIEDGLGKSKFIKIDFDRYDLLADHVLVKEKNTQKIIGTYRLLSSIFTQDFYSQNEFHLENFFKAPGNKLELGRACIHPDYRNGTTLNLIWKGLGCYAKKTHSDYLFGCASVKTIDPKLSMAIYQSLFEAHSGEYGVTPTKEFTFRKTDFRAGIYSQDYLDSMTPSLLRSYIKAGAKLHSIPAVDYSFDCIDFLTILNLNKVDERYKFRYFQDEK